MKVWKIDSYITKEEGFMVLAQTKSDAIKVVSEIFGLTISEVEGRYMVRLSETL